MKSGRMYKWIRISGLLSLLPIVLAAAPLAAYWAGDFLVERASFPRYTVIVCVIIGFAAGLRESVRIIKAAIRTAEGPDGDKG
jgi:hypothetical protein